MGWAVFRVDPWHLAGFYPTAAEAHSKLNELGFPYLVKHGTKALATDDFKWYRAEESDE